MIPPPPPKLVNTTFTTAACAARLDAIRPTAAARVVAALVALRRKLASCKRLDAGSAGRASAGSVLGCMVKWNLPRGWLLTKMQERQFIGSNLALDCRLRCKAIFTP